MTTPTEAARLVADLVALLRLEPLDTDRFRGASEDIGTRSLYGGQVLGQAVMAASRTVARPIHSLHAYFLLPGDQRVPIDYAVERVRDGRSSTRRALAQQQGRTLFAMMASFQPPEPTSIAHQRAMPAARGPEGLVSEVAQRRALADRLPPQWRAQSNAERPIEFRRVDVTDLLNPELRPAERQIWLRALAVLPDEPALHCAVLAYASDWGLLRVALRPHGLSLLQRGVRGASLDHAMWFHRPLRVDDWLLYCIDSPSAYAARALCRGELYARDGALVASVAQEGMLRVLSKQ